MNHSSGLSIIFIFSLASHAFADFHRVACRIYITLLPVVSTPEAFSPLPYLQMLQMVHQSVTVMRSLGAPWG